ncbi:M14 family zinc carboxypeptidase [Sphingomonas colocasiae]|uniref:Peptidase M14 domain-containing protein n=1 Tax=Sphingomonas colocasiae TaxID=1848973 RepID=A0ABS7PKX8_9SPHN|nr:M14 family zinc carboxypeptidase [Sphingomonas colocasiae]MBY8821893.1 hypothetical protein [Sphingomonas colocasiae]
MAMGISRRTMLSSAASTVGAAWLAPACARAGQAHFLDGEALAAMIRPELTVLGGAVQVERLGESGQGRPIDLISIGNGERSALIVGAPHPNEPIGCLTVLALIRRLVRDRHFREQSGWRWHFIPAIDVDGLALNRGWFSGPRTIDRYLAHFYRPAFARQPEYGFPLEMPGYRFDAVAPEAQCWQRAMEIARPDLQSSLHGADSGGSFYLLSQDRPALAAKLSRQPATQGILLNDLGEPGAELTRFAPGVFSYFDVAPYVAQIVREGGAVQDQWSAGRSSAEFAAERYGTFSVTCEVPLWEDPRQRSARPSGYSMADVQRMQHAAAAENGRLLDAAAPLIARPHADPESRALADALAEAATRNTQQNAALAALMRAGAGASEPVSLADLAQLEPGTEQMRAPAMLARLARRQGDTATASAAETLLARRIAALHARSPLRPVPTDKAVALQILSITTAMEELA